MHHDADEPQVTEAIEVGPPLCRPTESERWPLCWLGKAVKILSLNGLHPLNSGARVSFGKGKPTVTDGPFIETKEVLGGYWMVEANSKEELVKWAQRCPADEGDVIEIRQIFDEADFAIKK